MRRSLRYATAGLVLLGHAACTAWQDETKGTDTSTAPIGQGGAGSCIGCYAYLQALDTCADPDCPSADDVCAGAPRDALDAFLACTCGACAAQCPDLCADAGGSNDACEGCTTAACLQPALECMNY